MKYRNEISKIIIKYHRHYYENLNEISQYYENRNEISQYYENRNEISQALLWKS